MLEPGQLLLNYRLVEKIGEGGMGVVWKAIDTTLARDVAIKLLPEGLTADPERLTRFDREAKLLASLNHPGIAGVYGLHEVDGTRFLAMELVGGEDLAARIARGSLAVDEAIDVARQVAEALEAAHECGIVHRDLKPANIRITAGGKVKVLDFGLAKALDPTVSAGGSGDPSLSPTFTSAGTRVGMVLGTCGYMSPEQARGKPVDRRADIWAFGVVLYEMLTGAMLFSGETVSDSLAAVLTRDVDWTRLPARTPSPVRQLLRRCLERDPRMRLRDIGEARVLLESPMVSEVPSPAPPRRSFGVVPILLAVVAVAAIAAAVGAWMFKPVPVVPLRRFSLASPVAGGAARESARISPDGRSMAYLAAGKLWIQDLDQLTARPVTGGEGAGSPVWSPDGTALAFTVGPRLFRALVGGDPKLIAELPAEITGGGGLAWTDAGTMVYSTGQNDLLEVPATGGSPRSILAPVLSQETDFHEPSALPQGRGVIYVVHRSPQGLDTLEVLAGGKRKVVYQDEGSEFGNPRYSPTGHIVFERRDASRGIWAVPFSLSTLAATGAAVLVTAQGSGPTVSVDGTLLYTNVSAGGGHQLVVIDRNGEIAENLGDPMQHIDNATLSPDQTHLAVCAFAAKGNDLWIFDLARRSRRMLVHDAHCGSQRGQIAWFRNEPSLLFGNTESRSVERQRTDGKVGTTKVTEGLEPTVSPDGRWVAFVRETESTFTDLWSMPLDGSSPPRPILATRARESDPAISPDGKLLAYASDETGRSEVYIRDFSRGESTWRVSDRGGSRPRWSASGDRLYFLEGGRVVVEAELTPLPELQVTKLTRWPDGTVKGIDPEHGYDVFADGNRIVTVRSETVGTSAGDLTLVTGWRGP